MTLQLNSRLYRFILCAFMIVNCFTINAQVQNLFTKDELFTKIQEYKALIKESLEDKLAPLPQELVIKSFSDIQSYLPSNFDKNKVTQAGISLANYVNEYNSLHANETFDMIREGLLKEKVDKPKLPCFSNLRSEIYDTVNNLAKCCTPSKSKCSECSLSAAVSIVDSGSKFNNCLKQFEDFK